MVVCLVVLLLELINSGYLIYLVSGNARFKNFLFSEIHLWQIIIGFYVRVFLGYICLFGVLGFITWILQIKNIKSFYCFNILLLYMIVLLIHPQAFEEFSPFVKLADHLGLFYKASVLLPVCYLVFVIGPFLFMTRFDLVQIKKALICSFILLSLIKTRDIWNDWTTNSTRLTLLDPVAAEDRQSQLPNIYFVILDSTNKHDFFNQMQYAQPSVTQFVERAFTPTISLTPIAQTHGALTSLFTGKLPYETTVRTNLSASSLNADMALDGSAIQQFYKMGYKVHLWQDVEEYSNFTAGNSIFDVQSPSYPVANVIVSTFFKNRLSVFLASSGIADLFLPEVMSNNSFFMSYRPQDFLVKIRRKMKTLPRYGQMIFIHTCAAHWPGQFPYPYYSVSKEFSAKGNLFSYNNKFFSISEPLSLQDWKARSLRNKKIYENGLRFQIEQFLNPLFDSFKELQLFDYNSNSVFALISDHGEDFAVTDPFFPHTRTPSHGGSLLFSARSEQQLSLLYPRDFFSHIGEYVSSTELLPYILAQLNHTKAPSPAPMKYVETGLWPMSSFRSQFLLNKMYDLAPIFRFDRKTESIYVSEDVIPSIIIQKQRAVYSRDLRLTMYPTDYGHRFFLCNTVLDQNCTHNLLNSHEIDLKLKRDMQREIEKSIEADVSRSLYFQMNCDHPISPQSFEKQYNSLFSGQYLFHILKCLNRDFKLKSSYQLLDIVLQKPSNEEVKKIAYRHLLYHCLNFSFFQEAGEFPGLKEFISQKVLTQTDNPQDVFCAKRVGLNLQFTRVIASQEQQKIGLSVQDVQSMRVQLQKGTPLSDKQILDIQNHDQYYKSDLFGFLSPLNMIASGKIKEYQQSFEEMLYSATQYGMYDELASYYSPLSLYYVPREAEYKQFMQDLFLVEWPFEWFHFFVTQYHTHRKKEMRSYLDLLKTCFDQDTLDCRKYVLQKINQM